MKKITTTEFIKKAEKIHGDKYDYSKINYINATTKICIICPIHGEFWQEPRVHLSGGGCKLCANEYIANKNTKNIEYFISKAKQIHGDKYDYSKVKYKNILKKVCIICPKHGEFWQTPDNHLHGHGCRKCLFEKLTNINKSNKEEFIEKAKQIHGDKYDYSKVEYKNCDTNVKIVCPTHGEFEQTPYNHLHSSGCPHCKNWKLEEEISKFLENNNISFIRQKKFKWLGRQSLDIYIPQYNIAIECQGEQHFRPINYFGGIKGFKKRVELDNLKNKLCKENGIKILYYSKKEMGKNIITNKKNILEEIKKSII